MPSLITLNIEHDMHLDRVDAFLERERPDILCLQEVYEQDAARIAGRFGYFHTFLPMMIRRFQPTSPLAPSGIALFSKVRPTDVQQAYYYRPGPEIREFDLTNMETVRATISHGVLWATLELGGKSYVIATTHFTWTPDGNPSDNQRQDARALLQLLAPVPQLILCGDFNAPRGENDVYHLFCERFTDNIPATFRTTMDVQLHKVKDEPAEREKLDQFVVDYIFSTPGYAVSDVRQEFGVSDHTAILATVA